MNIKRIPLNEINAIIKRLESEGRFNDAELFKKAIYGRIRELEKIIDHGEKRSDII